MFVQSVLNPAHSKLTVNAAMHRLYFLQLRVLNVHWPILHFFLLLLFFSFFFFSVAGAKMVENRRDFSLVNGPSSSHRPATVFY